MMRDFLDQVIWFVTQPQAADRPGQIFGFQGMHAASSPALHYPKQVHGRRIIEAGVSTKTDAGAERAQADGIFTRNADEKVAVQTADCLPVLFAHPGCAMAVHAGWRGLVDGILVQAVETLQSLQIPLDAVTVILGPAISQAAFEVGPELVDRFHDYFADLAPQALPWVLMKGQADRWHIDLAMAACLSFQALGLAASQISCYRVCTKSMPHDWHSYRRDGQKAGRNWSWVSL